MSNEIRDLELHGDLPQLNSPHLDCDVARLD